MYSVPMFLAACFKPRQRVSVAGVCDHISVAKLPLLQTSMGKAHVRSMHHPDKPPLCANMRWGLPFYIAAFVVGHLPFFGCQLQSMLLLFLQLQMLLRPQELPQLGLARGRLRRVLFCT